MGIWGIRACRGGDDCMRLSFPEKRVGGGDETGNELDDVFRPLDKNRSLVNASNLRKPFSLISVRRAPSQLCHVARNPFDFSPRVAAQRLVTMGTIEFEFVGIHVLHHHHAQKAREKYIENQIILFTGEMRM